MFFELIPQMLRYLCEDQLTLVFKAYVNVVIIVHESQHETLMSTFVMSEVYAPTMSTCGCFYFRVLHVLRVAFTCAYLSVKWCLKMDTSNKQVLVLKLYL